MTNQLLLAQVLAEGFSWDYLWHWTHDLDVWKAVIPASATVIASLIAIVGVWLTARRATQQMELSKQGTPPELTRYKEWLEISKNHKNLIEFEKSNKFEDLKNEYQEIRKSRKAALERAVWERKVISVCPDINGQKRLLNVPEGIIVSSIKIKSIPNFGSAVFTAFEVIISVLIFIFVSIFMATYPIYIFNYIVSGDWDIVLISKGVFLIGFIPWLSVFFNNAISAIHMSSTGKYFAEYGYLRTLQENISNEAFKDVLKNSSTVDSNSQRFFFALWNGKYRNFVSCPKAVNSRYLSILGLIIFGLPYWVVNWGHKKRGYNYGEYKPEVFGISEKVSEGEQAEQDENLKNLKGKKSFMSRRIVLWVSKKWESLNHS